jgi:iron complex transport system substrate-binding protein
MGRKRVMAPGDDSFQNELIRLAGGIPPKFGKTGAIVPLTLEEWKAFNPQMIYACGGDRKAAEKQLEQPGWGEVDAVKNRQIRYFPCELTCRLSSRTGYFVSCLAATLYGEEFASLPSMKPDEKLRSKPVSLPLEYVGKAEVVESRVNDYTHKTLVIQLNAPMSVTSTLEGYRDGIRFVGNSYSPPQVWGLYHYIGLEASRKQLLASIDLGRQNTSLLFTGANMDNLSVQKQKYKEMVVYALVTAGVKSNAVRMAEDVGRFYEPGTINMVVLSNMKLTPRAMNRAIISATEAKSAALQDLDIRSAYTAMRNPATGTGTDNIIVVEGTGNRIDNAGGHSKMGELIAKAVYAGVKEAAFKQNGLVQQRSVYHRLKERKISLFGLVDDCTCGISGSEVSNELERLLLNPEIAGFIESALAINDQYERGLISDIASFEIWSDQISERIAGNAISQKQTFSFSTSLPPVLKIAFEALLNGIAANHQTR